MIDPRVLAGLAFFVLLGFCAAVFVLAVRSSRRKVSRLARPWGEFATSRGLDYTPPRFHPFGASPPRIAGHANGVNFEGSFALGGGGPNQTQGAATVFTRPPSGLPHPVTIRVVPRGLASFGNGQSVPTGDSEFDGRFSLMANPPAALSVVGPELRGCLCLFARSGRNVTFELFHRTGNRYIPDKCRLVLDHLEADPAFLDLAIRTLLSPVPG